MHYHKRVGTYITSSVAGEVYESYIPKPLPPNPPLQMEKLYSLLELADIAVGRLDGMSVILPDPTLFLYFYIRKEAILSSQIEGTQSTLADLLLFENSHIAAAPLQNDIIEVSNYVAAMNHGLMRIKNNFPLSLRLICEMHEILLNKGRGSSKQPGEFRRSQNWIGGTRPGNAKFVPPPPEKLRDLLSDLEKFLHDDTIKMPVLIKAALAHVQFETIHPFLDGNGRIGRLLLTFILCINGIIQQPLLYLSIYFKKNRQLYYDHLQLVRETGDWEEWLQFFLQGVIETANQAIATAQSILKLFAMDREKISIVEKSTVSLMKLHDYLQKNPITNTKTIVQSTKLTLPTVLKSLNYLIDLDIVKEISGKERNKIYVYQQYLKLLSEDTDPLQ